MKTLESKLIKIFTTIFNLKKKINVKNLKKKKIKNWDSLNHVLLLMSIQDTFKIKFKLSDYEKLDSFNNILNFLKKK